MAYEDSEYYSPSEKKYWKMFKREGAGMSKSSTISIDPSLMRSISQKNTSSRSPSFRRSVSQKSSSPYSAAGKSSFMCRSSSLKSSCTSSPAKNPHKSNNLVRSFSKKSSAFGKKCTHLAKEQKARFYIMKRSCGISLCTGRDVSRGKAAYI